MEDKLSFEPQIKHICGQLCGAYQAARNLMRYGTSQGVLEVAMSNQLGVAQFGLNIMPKLSDNQANSIQKELNRTIRTVLGIKPKEDGSLMPNREVLKEAGIMPIHILQIKLALCRMNGILVNKKPAFLHYITQKLIIYSDGSKFDNNRGQMGMSYLDLLKWGRRDIELEIPTEFKEHPELDQEKIKNTFPFTCVEWFNNLPVHIRNTLSTPKFDTMVTAFLKTSCYHRLNGGDWDGCSHCLNTANKTQFDADKIIEQMKIYFEHEGDFSQIKMDYTGTDAFLAVADLKLFYGDWNWEEIVSGKRNRATK